MFAQPGADPFPSGLDEMDHWFAATVELPLDSLDVPGRQVLVELDGVATIADFFWNGQLIGASESMYAEHSFNVSKSSVVGDNHLVVHCRSLTRWLSACKAPRARWKTRLVEDQKLRAVRTTLLGRATGWSPPATVVGLWRDVRVVVFDTACVESSRLRSRVDAAGTGRRGLVSWSLNLVVVPDLHPVAVELVMARRSPHHEGSPTTIPVAIESVGEPFNVRSADAARGAIPTGRSRLTLSGELTLEEPELWWPHTHGDPACYETWVSVRMSDGSSLTASLGTCGFRSVAVDTDCDGNGFGLVVNDVPVFARGGAWFPLDPATLSVRETELRERLSLVAFGGHNMVRVSGTCAYESSTFFSLCDELGLLVWHDLALANFDYPQTESFDVQLRNEATAFLVRAGNSPALVVLCAGSEVQQQAAMMGVDASVAVDAGHASILRTAVEASGLDAVVVDSSPFGGHLPFSVDSGVAHYFGVGAYRRPLTDARHSGVRFAAECLAFSNVPVPATVRAVVGEGVASPSNPVWKQRVPRDRGTAWDFEDVREYYVRELFGLDPADLRFGDPERYLAVGRAVTCAVIERTLGEWRRPQSSCHGALLWTLNDLWPGAGWGLIDSFGRPKAAFWGARRALAPVALVGVDEGLNGLDLYAYNDRSEPLSGTLEVRATKGTATVRLGSAAVDVAAHGSVRFRVDQIFGAFSDPTYAYRFGPRAIDSVSAVWRSPEGVALGRYVFVPSGERLTTDPALTIEASARRVAPYAIDVELKANRLAQFVTLDVGEAKLTASDDHFMLAPDMSYVVRLEGDGCESLTRVFVSALNASSETAVGISPMDLVKSAPSGVGTPA